MSRKWKGKDNCISNTIESVLNLDIEDYILSNTVKICLKGIFIIKKLIKFSLLYPTFSLDQDFPLYSTTMELELSADFSNSC